MPYSRLLAALLPAFFLLPAAAAPEPSAQPPLQTIHRTTKPGGVFGFWGPDISTTQKVAGRFTMPAGADLQLARVAIYLMNNSDTQHPVVRLSLQSDLIDEGGSETLPSGVELESWNVTVEALGWNPIQQGVTSVYGPRLRAGANYWVVAESSALPLADPVWNFAATGTDYSTTSVNGVWQTAGSGAALTLKVSGTAVGDGPLPQITMSLASSTIHVGERTLMSWETRRAKRCFAGGAWSGQWPTEDSVFVSPSSPGIYDYQLTCTNHSGRSGERAVLTVLPAQ